jgi:hypothetical protein
LCLVARQRFHTEPQPLTVGHEAFGNVVVGWPGHDVRDRVQPLALELDAWSGGGRSLGVTDLTAPLPARPSREQVREASTQVMTLVRGEASDGPCHAGRSGIPPIDWRAEWSSSDACAAAHVVGEALAAGGGANACRLHRQGHQRPPAAEDADAWGKLVEQFSARVRDARRDVEGED